MQAVLISIKPMFCEMIANGKKTLEVRKTLPEIESPFKCYMYCTKAKKSSMGLYLDELYRLPTGEIKYGCSIELACYDGYTHDNFLNGKVIGEFVCDSFDTFTPTEKGVSFKRFRAFHDTCLTLSQMKEYLGGKKGYGWHISELKIYDEPRRLKDFWHFGVKRGARVTRAPQSWFYVEEVDI